MRLNKKQQPRHSRSTDAAGQLLLLLAEDSSSLHGIDHRRISPAKLLILPAVTGWRTLGITSECASEWERSCLSKYDDESFSGVIVTC